MLLGSCWDGSIQWFHHALTCSSSMQQHHAAATSSSSVYQQEHQRHHVAPSGIPQAALSGSSIMHMQQRNAAPLHHATLPSWCSSLSRMQHHDAAAHASHSSSINIRNSIMQNHPAASSCCFIMQQFHAATSSACNSTVQHHHAAPSSCSSITQRLGSLTGRSNSI